MASIAAAARDPLTRLACFVMGTNDLAKETRARLVPGRAAMIPWLMQALAAARAEGLDILDGVYNGLDDADGFTAECEQGRDMGFDGKTLIHPKPARGGQPPLSRPIPTRVARARAIIAAFEQPENAAKGAITLDGRMVERLHAEMAKRTPPWHWRRRSRSGGETRKGGGPLGPAALRCSSRASPQKGALQAVRQVERFPRRIRRPRSAARPKWP